jgi:hypothetical protein
MAILFGTVVKNIEGSIFQLIQFLTEITRELPEAHFFIYENNSTDKTRDYFPLMQSILSNIHILSEDYTQEELLRISISRREDNKPCRMELIAFARNKLLDMIESHGYTNDDLIVMFDCDMRSIPTKPLFERLRAFPDDIDALFANGLSTNCQTYYDMYALRFGKNLLGPEIRGLEFWDSLPRIVIQNPTSVLSAFGGLAIYKGYCLKQNRYSALPTQALDILNKQIIQQTGYKPASSETQTQYKGAPIGIYLFGSGPDDIFYLNNSGYNYPVVCEHSTLHAEMMLRGQGRFRIDPDLKYYSDH